MFAKENYLNNNKKKNQKLHILIITCLKRKNTFMRIIKPYFWHFALIYMLK